MGFIFLTIKSDDHKRIGFSLAAQDLKEDIGYSNRTKYFCDVAT